MQTVMFPELGLNFNIDPVAFSIGSFSVAWYGIIIAVGFLLGTVYAVKSCKQMNINSDHLFDAIILGLILGIIGARLYYVIFYPGDKYIQNPIEILYIHQGGLGIYGGIIGGLAGGVVVSKIRKINIFACLDVAVLGFLIGQSIGRWGNFINQEAFGGPTDLPWGMQSENTVAMFDSPVHPTFLYESILCALGFVVLHFFTRKFRKYDGQTFLLYLVWYGISRFFIEGLRTDSLYIPNTDIRVSQAVALVTVVAAIALLVKFRKRTSLTGCGDKDVMLLNNVVIGTVDAEQKAVIAEKKKAKQQEKEAKIKAKIPTESTLFKGKEYMSMAEETEDSLSGDNEETKIDKEKVEA